VIRRRAKAKEGNLFFPRYRQILCEADQTCFPGR
jgi:hypothetical protein